MNIAYLIAAHNNPAHLSRLLQALASPNSAAFVHVDKKSSIDAFTPLASAKVQFTDARVAVYWGEFSLVEATLVLLRQAWASNPRADYFVLLSGSDYPLCPPQYIEQFLEWNRDTEYMNIVAMPNERASKPLTRLTHYKVLNGSMTTLPEKVARRALTHLGMLPKDRDFKPVLGPMQPFAGSQWWTLSRAAVEYILNFIETRPDYTAYFRNTWFPDEVYFHTILGNSSFRERMRHNLMYTDWVAGGAHPALLSEKHVERFTESPRIHVNDVYGAGEALFARKFSDASAALLDGIDQVIERKRKARATIAPQHALWSA
jgi:hypothetical protein